MARKSPTRKKRVGWTLPLENDPLYPFPKSRPIAPADTAKTSSPSLKKSTWGKIKEFYRRSEEDG